MQTSRRRWIGRAAAVLVLALGLSVGLASNAHAAQILTLSSGGQSVTFTNGGGCVAAGGATCVISVSASGKLILEALINGFSVDATGTSKGAALFDGTPANPHMDLLSLVVAGGGDIDISHFDDGWTALGNSFMSIGGTTSGGGANTVSYSAFWNANLIGNLGPFSGPAFSGSGLFGGPTSGPYSLTQIVHVHHDGLGTTSFDAELRVPEPASLALFGMALVGLGAVSQRRRKMEQAV